MILDEFRVDPDTDEFRGTIEVIDGDALQVAARLRIRLERRGGVLA